MLIWKVRQLCKQQIDSPCGSTVPAKPPPKVRGRVCNCNLCVQHTRTTPLCQRSLWPFSCKKQPKNSRWVFPVAPTPPLSPEHAAVCCFRFSTASQLCLGGKNFFSKQKKVLSVFWLILYFQQQKNTFTILLLFWHCWQCWHCLLAMLTLLILIIEAIWDNAKLYWSNLKNVNQSINLHHWSKRC